MSYGTTHHIERTESRSTSTFWSMGVQFEGQGFFRIAFDSLGDDLMAKVRHAVLIGMADAGHVPPIYQSDDPDDPDALVTAFPPPFIQDHQHEDYWQCLENVVNMVADRIGWPGLEALS